MNNRASFIDKIPPAQHAALVAQYPAVSLHPQPFFTPLAEVPALMLVAFTGTGKTTTLDALRERGLPYAEQVPARRELTDLLIIPAAQVLENHPVEPVADRVKRFAYTKTFAAQYDTGGAAFVYSCLYYQWDGRTPLVSDGVRGAGEIRYVLAHCPAWRVVELWIPPLLRLQRLTQRDDVFDQAAATLDFSFLPAQDIPTAQAMLAEGKISARALAIVGAEAKNYGIQPFDPANQTAGYHFINGEGQTPAQLAERIAAIMQD